MLDSPSRRERLRPVALFAASLFVACTRPTAVRQSTPAAATRSAAREADASPERPALSDALAALDVRIPSIHTTGAEPASRQSLVVVTHVGGIVVEPADAPGTPTGARIATRLLALASATASEWSASTQELQSLDADALATQRYGALGEALRDARTRSSTAGDSLMVLADERTSAFVIRRVLVAALDAGFTELTLGLRQQSQIVAVPYALATPEEIRAQNAEVLLFTDGHVEWRNRRAAPECLQIAAQPNTAPPEPDITTLVRCRPPSDSSRVLVRFESALSWGPLARSVAALHAAEARTTFAAERP